MTLVTRNWGSFPSNLGNPVSVGLETSAVQGQHVALGCIQTASVLIDNAGRLILTNDSCQPILDHITVNASATPKLVNFSFNVNPYGDPQQGEYILTDFVLQILVEPYSAPVNLANIQNALAGTFLEYVTKAPAGTFNTTAYLYGTPTPTPTPTSSYTVNRAWGADPGLEGRPIDTGLEANAHEGQYCAVGVIQNLPLVLATGLAYALQNYSLDILANAISNKTHADCKLINFSGNLSGDALTDFVCQIVVNPISNDYPVNGANIQNSITGTILTFIKESVAGTFNTTAYIYGSPISEVPFITPIQLTKLRNWIDQEEADEPEAGYQESETEITLKAGAIWRRGAKVGFQREDRFSPVNSFAFSPLTQTMSDFQNVALVGILAAASRSPEGLKMVMHFAEKYMDDVTKILTSILDAGTTHPMTGSK